jgi:hypothetical protein
MIENMNRQASDAHELEARINDNMQVLLGGGK